jgi:glycosyltransferase involved in cell wall biosynthesis
VGDGETRATLEAYLHTRNIAFSDGSDRAAPFIFAGWAREVDKVLPGLDIVCLTSRNEGPPVSLIEAQAAGKPIVCSPMREVLKYESIRFASDAEEFVQKIEEAANLASDSEYQELLRREAGENTWLARAEKLSSAVKQAEAKRRHSPDRSPENCGSELLTC